MRVLLLVGLVALMALMTGASAAHAEERMTFAQAVATAIARNPNVTVARSAIATADAQRRQVRAQALPTLLGNATYTHLDNNRLVNGNVASAENQINLNFTLTAPLIAARAWGAWRRASDTVEVTRAGVKATERDAALAAARAYLAVVNARRLLEVAVIGRETADAHLAFADKRYGGGVGTKLDVVRSAQEVESAATQVATSEVGLTRAKESLGVVLGLDGAVDAIDEPAFPPIPESVNETARADVAAAKRALWAAERGGKDLWRDFLPTLTAIFQPFYQNPPTLTVPLLGWQGQLALVLPIYDAGLRYGLQAEREAQVVANRARLEAASRQARADVRIGRAAVRGADVAQAKAKRAASLAHEAAELAKLAYQGGAATNLELIDADRRARDADTQAAQAEDALRTAELEALASSGVFP